MINRLIVCLVTVSALTIGCAKHNDNGNNSADAREGTVITSKFLASNSGTFLDTNQNGVFTINSDGSFKKLASLQVGAKGEDIPYPTVCRFYQYGTINKVYERSEEARKTYFEYATHLIKVTVTKVELDRSPNSNDTLANCEKFERQENSRAPILYNIYSEVISANLIRLHNSGGGDLAQGKPRPESTLDENFYREGSLELKTTVKPNTDIPDYVLFTEKSAEGGYQHIKTIQPLRVPIFLFSKSQLAEITNTVGLGVLTEVHFRNGQPIAIGNFDHRNLNYCTIFGILNASIYPSDIDLQADLDLKYEGASVSSTQAYVLASDPNPVPSKNSAYRVSCTVFGDYKQLNVGLLRSAFGSAVSIKYLK
jgi:hypothetical protein